MTKQEKAVEEILKGHNFIVLTTFKKSGEGVTTPIWFVFANSKVYFYTFEKAWKVKRLKKNPNVEFAPANARMFAPSKYTVIGRTIRGIVRSLAKEEAEEADRLLSKKYGFKYWMFNKLQAASFRGKNIYFEVTPKGVLNE
jgi:PPOX class probable F420-dependent enzyme